MNRKLSKGTIIASFLTGLAIGVLAAVVYVFVISPGTVTTVESPQSSGEIEAINTNLFDYDGPNPLEIGVPQKGLGVQEILPEAAYIFGKGDTRVEVYADFSSQRSRDFFLMNQNTLAEGLKNGELTLTIYPLASDNSYSMYASEAVAEVFVLDPEKAWEFLLEAFRNNGNISTKDDMLNTLTNIGIDLDVNIDAVSISGGSFASWIGNSEFDMTGKTVPLVKVNGKEISDDITITSEEEFREALRGI